VNPRNASRLPGLRIAATYERMSLLAADFITAELSRRPDLLLCASAGDTPTLAYDLLGVGSQHLPPLFERLRVCKIDEWAGLAADHPAGCETYLRDRLLRPLGIGPDRRVGFRGDAPDPQRECARIARWLAAHGPIDVCVLGLGTNGHVALNEPADTLTPHAHVVALARSSRQHPMIRSLRPKPTHGMTLGLAEILASRRILLLVSGRHKSPALARLLRPGLSTRFPASFLWLHPDVTILCDREAAADLPREVRR